jgi:DNA-binding HxlR family transcriptional regulator
MGRHMAKHMTLEECPVKLTVDVIGGKWKPIILYYLNQGPRGYGELQRLVGSITKKVLTQQIRELERDDIVERRLHSGKPPRAQYMLSEHGRTLKRVLESMASWGEAHRARYGVMHLLR